MPYGSGRGYGARLAARPLVLDRAHELAAADPPRRLVVSSLESELNNLRAALRFLLDARETEHALRLAADLEELWLASGHYGEGRAWLEEALESGEGTLRERARALLAAGWVAFLQGEYGEALRLLERSLELFQQQEGDAHGRAKALERLGAILSGRGDYGAARAHLRRSLALYTQLEHAHGQAQVSHKLGILAKR